MVLSGSGVESRRKVWEEFEGKRSVVLTVDFIEKKTTYRQRRCPYSGGL